jgi:hypothetical protein
MSRIVVAVACEVFDFDRRIWERGFDHALDF